VLTALGELELAQEELRVAEEELARNREQLKDLVAEYESGRRWREHLFAVLAVGIVVTDDVGTVQSTNAAGAALLGVRPPMLVGQPLSDFVDTPHRPLVSEVIDQLARGEPELSSEVTLRTRGGEAREVHLIGLRDPEATPVVIRWLLKARDPTEGLPHEPELTHDDDLRAATAIARLCSLPVEGLDQQRIIGQITLVVRSAVGGSTSATVTIGDPLAPDRLAADSNDAQRLDGLQMQAAEGPCIDAYRRGTTVVAPDLTSDGRWPRLVAASRDQPLRSVLALPIRFADETAGVINVYGAEPGAFPARSVRVGEVLAAAVAAVLRDVDEHSSMRTLIGHLERALDSRAVIDQAKGMVMAAHGGSAEEAFARMITFSSRNNVKLRDLAKLVVEGGTAGRLRGL
jgi:PAS domain S-box-containing protein